MRILISNDDGIYADGIQILAQTLRTLAEIDIVAPDRNRSGASNSLTLYNPLRVKKIAENQLSVEGTPTDCVHLAITGLMHHKPDMVIAGINAGSNLGDDVLYSGTVAAATEGRFLGYPAIAVSLVGEHNKHIHTAAEVTKRLVSRIAKNPLPASTILNVNIPDLPLSEIKGIQATRLGTRHCAEPTVKTTDPRGNVIYWVGPPGAEQDAGPGTDFHAVATGYVSITPLQLDLTHYQALDNIASWVDNLQLTE